MVENKKLFKTARRSGVSRFGLFNDAGYRGLYGSPLSDIEVKKGIKKGELLDRAGATELAANLFRITQTDEKLKKDKVRGDLAAQRTHHLIGGKIRQTIKEIAGELPENLKPERNIKEVKREIKLLEKQTKKFTSLKSSPKTK
jgi:DNA-damage-inducible protein D